MKYNLAIMKKFSGNSLPNLDVCVLGALEFFSDASLPTIDLGNCRRPLVVGSGNAAATGKILFENIDAIFADESTYQRKLDSIPTIDGAVLISAAGGKHAVSIAAYLKKRGLETRLLTCNQNAPARQYLADNNVFLFPKNREPYTYNTSTYLGMILSNTKEKPKEILQFITKRVAKLIPQNLAAYDAFYFIVPPQFDAIREMYLSKFDELLQPYVSGRVFTIEQTKHSKTINQTSTEMFVSLGYHNGQFGHEKSRLNIPLPSNAGYATLLAIGYYIIGKIQSRHEPFFKNNIAAYVKRAKKLFCYDIDVIVE